MIMALKRIYIERTEVGEDSFDGFADDAGPDGDHLYLEDDETIEGLLVKLKPYAEVHSIKVIEIPIEAITIPD